VQPALGRFDRVAHIRADRIMLVSPRDAMQARCHPRAPRMRSAQKSFKPVTRKGLGGDAGAFLTQVLGLF